jgi:hypothetical protein
MSRGVGRTYQLEIERESRESSWPAYWIMKTALKVLELTNEIRMLKSSLNFGGRHQ